MVGNVTDLFQDSFPCLDKRYSAHTHREFMFFRYSEKHSAVQHTRTCRWLLKTTENGVILVAKQEEAMDLINWILLTLAKRKM